MPKASKKRSSTLAFDLGGTKIAAAIIDDRGKILKRVQASTELRHGPKGIIDQLSKMGLDLLSNSPEIDVVGLASAGPLDPARGVLLDPTNLLTRTHGWGVVPLTRTLEKRFKRKVYLENDAAAAALAELWVGSTQGYQNSMILTLGTGVGTGVIANGRPVRSGRGLHTEAGHIIINFDDKTAPCGCGNYGCIEAYLSGVNFAKRMSRLAFNQNLTAKEISELAKGNHPIAQKAFEDYSTILAAAIASLAVVFSPEIVVFSGSFSKASSLYLSATRKKLNTLMKRRKSGINLVPKLKKSKLGMNASLLGAAYMARSRN